MIPAPPSHGPPPPTLLERSAGVLLHPTSLPGPFGCGDLGPASERFVRWLDRAGLRWWQMLPVGPLGFGNSPYSAGSAFAGNPLLLSLELLEEQGLLQAAPLPNLPAGRVDYGATIAWKGERLRRAYQAWRDRGGASGRLRESFERFCEAQASWLDDYALFAALKELHGGKPWVAWEPALRDREPGALAEARERLGPELELQRFLQWLFEEQWRGLRLRCRELGVGLIGDLPIFVAHDSADVWTHRELFLLDTEGEPTVVAGVPPDYFSEVGQRWGNPLYRWDVLRADGYRWWIDRLHQMLHRFDAFRLDHFIGFVRSWEIPASSPTAERGRWRQGPGAELFTAAAEALGPLPVIAEDLGVVTREVIELRDALGFPGIRLLQFAFGSDPQAPSFRPHNYPRHAVVYTGTHDNDTAEGWFRAPGGGAGDSGEEALERERATRYLGVCPGIEGSPPRGAGALDPTSVHGAMVRAALASVADLAILPLQDLLGLGSEARMNLPGTLSGNWEWRFEEGALDAGLAARIAGLVRIYERDRGPPGEGAWALPGGRDDQTSASDRSPSRGVEGP